MKALELETASPDETAGLGEALGRELRPGDAVALAGELGAGKTVLVRGVARGVGGRAEDVRSPTFFLMTRYAGGRLPLVHVDAYRLSGPAELVDLGVAEVFAPEGATLVEWAPRVLAALPRERLEVELAHAGSADDPERRRIRFTARGARYEALLGRLSAALGRPGGGR